LSAQSKLYEGPALEPLIERIHRELGPDAKIISADRVRQGGVAGFFARQMFRLTVEVERPTAARRGRVVKNDVLAAAALQADAGDVLAMQLAASNAPTALHAHALTGAVTNGHATNGHAGNGHVTNVDVTNGHAILGGLATAVADPVAQPAPVADPIAALADSTTDVIELLSPLPSTETEPFARVLEQVAAAMEAAPPAATFEPVAVVETPAGPTAPVMAAAQAPAEQQPAPAVEQPVVLGADLGAGIVADPAAGIGAGSDEQFPLSPAQAAHRASAVANPAAAPIPAETERVLAEQLRRCGLPVELADEAAHAARWDGNVGPAVASVLRRLPDPPALPWRVGSLIAVVGDGTQAEALCCQLAQELNIDPSEVAFATPDLQARRHCPAAQIARSAGEAAERAPGWRRTSVAIVAIDAPVAGRQRSWANNVLVALRPTAVWGLVDAQCKAEDIRAWADDLGGIDALAVSGLASTVSPAAVLGTTIPVAFMDGSRASAERWAALVEDRMRR
jgi:hypothetical protein